ncbi:MAG: hypothetical protein ACO2Z9_11270 [Crocinitomicaceae bacterium]
MLIDSTYLTREVKELLNEMVGPPITLMERLSKGSIGSQRMIVDEYSEVFKHIFDKAPGLIYTNIELRPKGVLFHFNIKYTRYSWIIPFHKLVFISGESITIHSGEDKLFIRKENSSANQKFLRKLLDKKAAYLNETSGPNS